MKAVSPISDGFNHARRTSLRYLLDAFSDRDALLAPRDEVVNKTIPALFQKYETLMGSSEASEKLAGVKRLWAVYLESDERLLALSSRGEADFAQARALAAGATASNYVAAIKALGTVIDWSNEQGIAISVAADREYERGLHISLAMIACALGIGGVLARTITASIIRPLRQGVTIATMVASGDRTLRIDVAEKDEVAALLGAMQKMSNDLSVLVGSVRACGVNIAIGSHEIIVGSADLSRRTKEQAGNLEETSASMEQFIGAARSNAATASQAHELARSAARAASEGGTVVAEVVRTMSRIRHASRSISDITSLIDGIAFQTNFLALNAAVKAARAGKQRRGFAVVASEVRNLAQRSASAAKEIKTLIDESVATVDVGTGQASLAGRNMQDIVSQVELVGLLMGTISTATSEQTARPCRRSDRSTRPGDATERRPAQTKRRRLQYRGPGRPVEETGRSVQGHQWGCLFDRQSLRIQ